MLSMHTKPKSVFVRDYVRFRFGRIENVTHHWRSFPHQLPLFS